MEGFLERPVGRTWYRITGEGGRTPLVCLHGGPGSTHNYFRPLERLADERPVVLYDQLGCGRSDRPDDLEWCLEVFTEELDRLREQLGLDEIHLLGTSWGGMLAVEHALARPGSIRSLVLSSTLASADEWVVEAKRLRAGIEGDDDEVLQEFERRHLFRGAAEPLELARMREERSQAVYEAMWGPNEWTMTGALAGWDVRPRLAELSMPTLVLRGAHDLSTPAISKTLTDGIPHAREVVFAESSHIPVLEETERYLRTVRDSSTPSRPASVPPDAAAAHGFAQAFSGQIIRRDDPEYDAARVVWNGMIDRYPELVVRPTSADDVATAVRFAREWELPIAVRSGGHSIPGFSTCDDGIVIDLSRMSGARVDAAERTAWVNGGALLGELDREAQAVGLVCPVGVVSHTGVAGLTLGGGMGRLQRKHGLTIDNLLAVELVTADGRHVRASEDENPDLFWGLRGAGANFGIVTAFHFRLHPLEWRVTHGALVHPIERATELAARLCEVLESGPDELWAGFGLGRQPDGRPIARVAVLHSGSPEEAARDLADLRSFGPPLLDSIEPTPHLVPQTIADEAQAWGQRFSMKSAFVRSLDEGLVALCVDQVERAPAGGDAGYSAWACGGAIARVPEDATAFTGRSGAFWLAAESLWHDPDRDNDFRTWAREAMAAAEPYETVGRYVNDQAETGADVVRSVYGPAKYKRLAALKRAWDPDNVFRLNQNIPPA